MQRGSCTSPQELLMGADETASNEQRSSDLVILGLSRSWRVRPVCGCRRRCRQECRQAFSAWE